MHDNETRNMILEYLGTRFSNKQKQRFLITTAHKFINMGYSEKEMVVDKKKLSNSEYLNLYIGNFQTADRIITTYYDTPAKNFLPIHYKIGNSKNNYYINIISSILPMGLYFIFEIAVMWFLLIPLFQTRSNFKMILAVVVGSFLIYINTKIIHGIPNIHHFVRNTLSIIFIVDLCRKMTVHQRQKTVFVFTDHGCENRNGQNMLTKYISKTITKSRAKIIYLECIADLSSPVIYVNSQIIKKVKKYECKMTLQDVSELDYSNVDENDMFITNGVVKEDGTEIVSEKTIEKNFNLKNIKENFCSMQDIILNIV